MEGLERCKKELLTGQAVVTGKVVSLKGPKKVKKASRPRGGKKSKDEQNFKALVTVRASGIDHVGRFAWNPALTTAPLTNNDRSIARLPKALFGENPGHCAEGEWTASASDIMREPGYLTKFHADRALTEKVRLHTHASALAPPCLRLCTCAFGARARARACRRRAHLHTRDCSPPHARCWATAASSSPRAPSSAPSRVPAALARACDG